jgi:hypothetical protein
LLITIRSNWSVIPLVVLRFDFYGLYDKHYVIDEDEAIVLNYMHNSLIGKQEYQVMTMF